MSMNYMYILCMVICCSMGSLSNVDLLTLVMTYMYTSTLYMYMYIQTHVASTCKYITEDKYSGVSRIWRREVLSQSRALKILSHAPKMLTTPLASAFLKIAGWLFWPNSDEKELFREQI